MRTAPLWNALARAQARRAWLVLLGVLLVCVIAGFFGSKLTLKAGFEHLLPDGRASVVELHRVAERTGGVSTLFVVLEVPEGEPIDRARLRDASEAVTREVAALGVPWVGSASNGVQEALRFFEQRAGLFADKDELQKLRDEVKAYYDYQVAKEMGTLLDEDAAPPEVPLTPDAIKKRFKVEDTTGDRYPDGYFESADGRVHVITVRSMILGGDLDRGREALARVRAAVERVGLPQYHPKLTYAFAGDLYSGVAEVTAINEDTQDVGILGGILIFGIVLVFYLRLSTFLLMLVNILVGLVWSAGVAYYLVEHLNTATAFIFTILAGNGINTSIIFMARYLETRKTGEDVERAIAHAHRETWPATLSAAAASAAAYLSLQLTAFRGFRELGLVGGVGVLVIWVSTVLALPAMLAVVERRISLTAEGTGVLARFRQAWEASFGRPFEYLARRAPRLISVAGIALGVAGFGAVALYALGDPFEFDMNKIRNDPKTRAEEERVRRISDAITGYVGADGMAILVDDPSQVAPLREVLYARRDAAPADEKPFASLVALEDFVPPDQASKVPLLVEIRKQIEKGRKRKAISDEDWAKIERYLPPADLTPFTMADLPEGVARPFTEKDGTRGRIVYIVPTSPALTEDARYLLRWADSYRETKLPDGSTVIGSGRAVVYADMWQAVLDAVPVAVIAAFAAVMLVVLAAFRAGRPALLVIGALLVGIGWMAICLVLLEAKLNFLNFVALPITFGIGVEYAVNVVHRAVREGPNGALVAVRETGGAVVLCSLTTTLGYLALVGSMNFAVRSLGVAAVIGELCTILAAMLVLPAVMLWTGGAATARDARATPAS